MTGKTKDTTMDHNDYLTHHDDFRKACQIAYDAATNEADKSYWQHQIDTLDRLRDEGIAETYDDFVRHIQRHREKLNLFRLIFAEWPEMPSPQGLILLSRFGKWPEDLNRGKRIQREHGLALVPPKTECELGAGFWDRITEGKWKLAPGQRTEKDCYLLEMATQKGFDYTDEDGKLVVSETDLIAFIKMLTTEKP